MKAIATFLLILLLGSCGDSQTPHNKTQTIFGRTNPAALYRVAVDQSWRRVDPSDRTTLEDTKLPICEFFIDEEEGSVRISVHNFPYRIAPHAQVQRWKEQVNAPPHLSQTSHVTQAGYVGLFFETPTIMGWALQLSPDHWQILQSPYLIGYDKETQADVTIKATATEQLLQKHREEILAFANSFELLKELPQRP